MYTVKQVHFIVQTKSNAISFNKGSRFNHISLTKTVNFPVYQLLLIFLQLHVCDKMYHKQLSTLTAVH